MPEEKSAKEEQEAPSAPAAEENKAEEVKELAAVVEQPDILNTEKGGEVDPAQVSQAEPVPEGGPAKEENEHSIELYGKENTAEGTHEKKVSILSQQEPPEEDKKSS